MPELAQVRSLPRAYEIIKTLGLKGYDSPDELRVEARKALQDILQGRMTRYLDGYLEALANEDVEDVEDRRNGYYDRHLLSEVGDIVLRVPRTRRLSAAPVLEVFGRRMPEIDRVIMAGFVLGLSTRKVGKALASMLGEKPSATLVSNITKQLDPVVKAFHKRKFTKRYKALQFDGVVLSRKTGMGAKRKPVLVALGILPDGRKEVIDYRLASSESERQWEIFLTDLYKRGLTEEGIEIITVDGGQGQWAALDMVYPNVPAQLCWAHKTRNITDKVRRDDRDQVKRDVQKIYLAKTEVAARQAAKKFGEKWSKTYPKAVKSLRSHLDELVVHYLFTDEIWRKATRTTNSIERRFREVRRRTRPMGVFFDRTSMDRILFAVFSHENQQQGAGSLFSLTQSN